MTSYIQRSEVMALTWKSIQTMSNTYDGSEYRCGCKPHWQHPDKTIWLCEYHSGFDDAASLA